MNEKPELAEDSTELYEHFRFVVDKGQAQLRIDKYLFAKMENISRSRVQNSANAGTSSLTDQPSNPITK